MSEILTTGPTSEAKAVANAAATSPIVIDNMDKLPAPEASTEPTTQSKRRGGKLTAFVGALAFGVAGVTAACAPAIARINNTPTDVPTPIPGLCQVNPAEGFQGGAAPAALKVNGADQPTPTSKPECAGSTMPLTGLARDFAIPYSQIPEGDKGVFLAAINEYNQASANLNGFNKSAFPTPSNNEGAGGDTWPNKYYYEPGGVVKIEHNGKLIPFHGAWLDFGVYKPEVTANDSETYLAIPVSVKEVPATDGTTKIIVISAIPKGAKDGKIDTSKGFYFIETDVTNVNLISANAGGIDLTSGPDIKLGWWSNHIGNTVAFSLNTYKYPINGVLESYLDGTSTQTPGCLINSDGQGNLVIDPSLTADSSTRIYPSFNGVAVNS